MGTGLQDMKKELVFLIGGILTGLLAATPFLSLGSACVSIYNSRLLMIPFVLAAIGVFALIQFIVSRKRFQTLKNFYLLSAVMAFGSLIVLTRIVLGVGEGLITKLAKYFSDEQNSVFGLIILYGILLVSIIIFVAIFGLITKHKSEYIGKISDDVSRIAENGADIHVEEKGNDELTVLSRSINQMNADLQENKLRQQKAEQQKNELISNVSHDLRSPLTSIMGYVQLLKGYSDRNDEKFSEYIEVTDRRLKGLNGLINELFELTKMDSPDFRLNTEQGDVTAFIKQFGYEMQALLQQNSLNLENHIDDFEFIKDVDFDRLARVMENLFANVIKYAEPHTDVRLESKVGTGSISISLSNTIRKGAEVSTEDMFDRFYRDDQSRTDTDSAGLGLAIAKKIVDLHGGEISAKADKGVITVTVVLMK